jgi:hypothetical protein
MKTTFQLAFKAKKVHTVVYSGALPSGTMVSFYVPKELVPRQPEHISVVIEEVTT